MPRVDRDTDSLHGKDHDDLVTPSRHRTRAINGALIFSTQPR